MTSNGEFTVAECFISAWWHAFKGKGTENRKTGRETRKNWMTRKRGKKRDTEM